MVARITEFGPYYIETYRLLGGYETYVRCNDLRLSEFDSFVADMYDAIEIHELLCRELRKKCVVSNWTTTGF